MIATYTEAVQTVDPKQAVGKIKNLWIEFAKFYEKNGQVEDARIIFEKATQVAFMKVDDLARLAQTYFLPTSHFSVKWHVAEFKSIDSKNH